MMLDRWTFLWGILSICAVIMHAADPTIINTILVSACLVVLLLNVYGVFDDESDIR